MSVGMTGEKGRGVFFSSSTLCFQIAMVGTDAVQGSMNDLCDAGMEANYGGQHGLS